MTAKETAQYKLLEIEIVHLKEVISVKDNEREKALNMQADFYEKEKDGFNKRLNTLTDWKNNMQGRIMVIGIGLSAVWALLIGLLFWYLNKK